MATKGFSLEALKRLFLKPFRGKGRAGIVEFPGPTGGTGDGSGVWLEGNGDWSVPGGGGGGSGTVTSITAGTGLTGGGTTGAVTLAADFGTTAGTVTQGNDPRLSDARTPTAHATSHQHGGSDEVATATPGANAIVKANGSGKLASGWGGAASTLATLNASTKVVEDPANATATPTASKIPIADGSGKLDAWISVTSTIIGVVIGLKTAYNNASSVDIVTTSPDSIGRLTMYDGSAWQAFTVSATKNASLASSGAAGLDTGSEAASTFYHLWLIGKSDGTTAALLSLSSSAPTMPAGYTFKQLLGGVANDGSSNIVPFHHDKDGWVRYRFSGAIGYGGIQVLSGGTSTATAPPAAIDLSKAIPDVVGSAFEILADISNTGATGTRVDHFFSSTTTDHLDAATVAQTANWLIETRSRFRGTMHATRATVLYYAWAAATAGRSIDDFVTGFNLGIGHGSGGSPTPSQFSDDEAITGAINGVNNTFVLAHAPSPASSLNFFVDGVNLKAGIGYVLAGNTVTTQSGFTPQTGVPIAAWFRY